jgi:hypothetical protein
MSQEWESVSRRAWRDSKKWLFSSLLSWTAGIFIPLGCGVVTALFIAPSPAGANQVLYGAAGSVLGIGLFLGVVFLAHLILSLWRQRNEARKLCEEKNSEIEHILREAKEPIDFLRSIRAGDIISEKTIDTALLFKLHRTINNVTFERCVFSGPFIVGLSGNMTVSGNDLGGGKLENILIKSDSSRRYRGIGVFVNCRLLNCNFDRIGLLAYEKLYDALLKTTIVT